MKRWLVIVEAKISDEMEVEAETKEEAIENAHRDWSFTEAQDWTEKDVREVE